MEQLKVGEVRVTRGEANEVWTQKREAGKTQSGRITGKGKMCLSEKGTRCGSRRKQTDVWLIDISAQRCGL